MENIYVAKGYKNRSDYLANLAMDYGVSKNTVFAIAYMLGESEDFDGLITELEEFAEEDFYGIDDI